MFLFIVSEEKKIEPTIDSIVIAQITQNWISNLDQNKPWIPSSFHSTHQLNEIMAIAPKQEHRREVLVWDSQTSPTICRGDAVEIHSSSPTCPRYSCWQPLFLSLMSSTPLSATTPSHLLCWRSWWTMQLNFQCTTNGMNTPSPSSQSTMRIFELNERIAGEQPIECAHLGQRHSPL